MGENASQIEREIIAERAALGRNLDVLETKARNFTDWRNHYRNRPGTVLGAAVGVGVVLGALSHGRGHKSFGYVSYAHPPEPREPRKPLAERFRGPKARRLFESWGHLTDALLAVATAKAVDVVSDYLPGLSDEYRRQAEHGDPASRAFWQEQPGAARSASRSGVDAMSAHSSWDAGRDNL
jgi:hypothetical protein